MTERVTRRAVLGKAILLGVPALSRLSHAGAPDANAQAAFRLLSSYLTGVERLDDAQVQRIHSALSASDASFPTAAVRLWNWIEQHQLDSAHLQAALDAESLPFASLPRLIATAWFMGVAGEGDRARVVSFEHALNARIVGDVLKPPTYCYGGYASWSRPPV